MKNTVIPHQCFLHHWPNRLQRWPRVRGAFGVCEFLLNLGLGVGGSWGRSDASTSVLWWEVVGGALVSTSVSGWSFWVFDLRGDSSMG
jgi:hypothetical protein